MRSRRQLVGAVLAAAAATLAMFPGIASADGTPTARIDSVQVRAGHADFVLTTANVSGRLDAKTVRVLADQTQLPAQVTPVSSSAATAAPPRAVIIVLDTSGSMAASGIAAARQAALNYLASLPDDVQAGLLTFSDRPRLLVRPTTNRVVVRTALAQTQPAGATALYDAVQAAVATLDAARLGPSAQRRLVVLSDGVDTSSKASLVGVTRQLAAEHVPTDVVAFRYGAGDAAAVQQIAAASGGRTLSAQSAASLTAAFAAAARNFSARAKVEVTVPDALAGRTVTLLVSIGSVTAKAPLTFATVARPAPPVAPPPVLPHRSIWTWQLITLLAGVFLMLVLGVVLLRWQGAREDATQRLIRQLGRYGARHGEHPPGEDAGAVEQTGAVGLVGQVLRSSGAEQGLAKRLDLADLKRGPAEWVSLVLCAGAALGVMLMLLSVNRLLSLPIGLIAAWIAQHVLVSVRISRRRATFGEQLPDVLQLVVGSLRSGFSLPQAVDAVVRDGTQPAAGEFSRALAETRIGVDLEDGLNHVADRMRCDDLRWVVMATRIQREVGGNLAEVLTNTVDTMRERAQTHRQVRALSAEGRLSGYIIVGLPIVLGVWLTVSKPQYMSPLFTTPLGLVMVAGAVGLIVLGGFWIRALIKVEA
ncbi:VWA domain-containing protein [Kribbella sp. NPDC048928]|uniref:VWA domain-containing protein n=1 Tax=Kribbella sp. NPDC048928 TaxID=3364111 RepID=UPI00372487B3